MSNADGLRNYTGDGTSGVYIWGAQAENQSYATSYIPTYGAIATRNQETCADATPVINSEEGTLYAEVAAFANDASETKLIGLSDGTVNNYIVIEFKYGVIKTALRFNEVQINNTTGLSSTDGNYNKIAISWNNSTKKFKTYVNGVLNADLTFVQNPSDLLNELSFASYTVNSGNFFGNTKDLKVYPKALADVQLIDLTTI